MIDKILEAQSCGQGNCPCATSVRRGRGLTHCASHDDPTPSMNVDPASDGTVLVMCHGGCSQADVIKALRDKGLWRRQSTNSSTTRAVVNNCVPFVEDESRREVARYEYEKADGSPAYTIVRYEPKDFRALGPVPEEERVLYHLPEVIAGVATKQTIFVCEGEKDADALRGLGVIATCNPFGAGKFVERYAQDLIGANVVVCQDRDDAGRAHAKDVAQKLGVAARSVKILEFPDSGGRKCKDAADWAVAGSRLALDVLIDDLPEWTSGEKVIWTPRDLAREFIETMHKRKAGDAEAIGWPIGFGGVLGRELVYSPGDVWLIAASTGVGKSTFLTTLEQRATVPTIFFSVEMSRQQHMDRTISAATGIDSWKIRRGNLDSTEFAAVIDAANEYERRDDHQLVDNPGLTTVALESILRIARVRFGVRVAFLDYIQKLADKGDTEYSRVTAISNAVARIARQTGVCIVAAAQVNREAKDGEPPRKKDLRDSGYLEQDAAVILALGRAEGQSDTVVAIRKSRSGIDGFTEHLVFDAMHNKFMEKSEARRDRAAVSMGDRS